MCTPHIALHTGAGPATTALAFSPPHEDLQTSTRLITAAGSTRIVERRDELGAQPRSPVDLRLL
eukprot:3211-Prymnesium_polylepis.1